MATGSHIVHHLNTLGQGEISVWGFLPASTAFELCDTNYPHVFFYKSDNKFLSHLNCTHSNQNINVIHSDTRGGVEICWRIMHFSFFYIWVGALTVPG